MRNVIQLLRSKQRCRLITPASNENKCNADNVTMSAQFNPTALWNGIVTEEQERARFRMSVRVSVRV